MSVALFVDDSATPAVRGWLHEPSGPVGDALVLAHGAGSNAQAPLLARITEAFASAGVAVLRIDLPFRQARAKGPPYRGDAERDRQGIQRAAEAMRKLAPGRLFLGGHSYGGRQTSILASSEPALADALLLLSYPLHPPGRDAEPRTAHFPKLAVPALFVHGTRDPFGSIEELRSALALIPARTELLEIGGAGHELRGADWPSVAQAFLEFVTRDEPVRIPITDVFDLHSVPDRDVQAVVEAYLEEARGLGFRALRIIHGRGIGVRREIVRAALARTPFVEGYFDAPEEAGGWGATIVTLRQT